MINIIAWHSWRTRIMLTLLVSISMIVVLPSAAQNLVPRSVLGSGGSPATNTLYRMNGTVSQSVIGRMEIPTERNHNIGYWYTVQQMFLGVRYGALVVVANANTSPGTKIKIPILLQESKNLLRSSARNFTLVLKFNATLLEPMNPSGYTRSGDTGRLSITGRIVDSIGILAEPEFTAKLGNNETTSLIIEDFTFAETTLVKVARKDGLFSLDGVCREGGELRLTKSVRQAALSLYPNPVVSSGTIKAQLAERGETEIYLTDLMGRRVATYYSSKDAIPSELTLSINIADISSGSYFLLMRTPNEMFSTQVLVDK